jgi:penicillin-binding protein 2
MADYPDDERTRREQFTRRGLILGGAQAAGLGLIGWRLFTLQVVDAQRYAPMAEDNRTNERALAPKRGRIIDASGRVLADNEQVFRATITPALARNVGNILERVARILPLTDADIAQLVSRAKKQNRNSPLTIASDLTFDQVAKLNVYAPSLPGIKTVAGWRRRYRDGAALAQVVGLVGSVDRFGIDDDAVIRIPDIRIGKSGAELGFDADLRGAGGTQKTEVDARGRVVRPLTTIAPVAGRDVTLTIDSELQQRAVQRMQSERRASAVMIEVATGDIVLMASVPSFDPAAIAGGISEADWAQLSNSDDKPLLNRAVAGLYAPGSTFLPVTALTALEAGVVTLDEHIVCTGKYEYGGETFRCSNPKGHGSVTVHDAIRSSCEVFFYNAATKLGIARIANAGRAVGLGATSSIGLPEEKAGVVPDPDWKRGNLNGEWVGGETLLTAVGQGFMQATPLQLATAAARVASGLVVKPVLRKADAVRPEGAEEKFQPLPFSKANLDAVRRAMSDAVNDATGIAKGAKLGEGKPTVGGEIGASDVGGSAAQTGSGGAGDGPKRRHALFIGYEPADAPRYAIATVVENSGDGTASGAIARDILAFTLDRDSGTRTKSDAGGSGVPAPEDHAKQAG